ncbi:F-box/LRR-repeat protein [Trifolium pratense]|uniref:F-box/LRR-repeat protein n=1 Tax=Trifolium pratense TaxID=57577 RepID=A0A2K3NID0_TRIPR|nr:F-box/LRR-repeat protein [Trifolium pratense]
MEKFCGRRSKSDVLIRSLEKVDRISELPDELLIHILSFLPPKFACTTSVLSKRWKPLCKFLTVLRFDDKSVKDFMEFNFFNIFINNVMLSKDMQRQPIKAFHLRCHSAFLLFNHNDWIEAAKQRGVEDLQLSMLTFKTAFSILIRYYAEGFQTISPSSIFSCRTLVILKLKRLRVAEDLKKLISASLVLEDLYIMVGYIERASIPIRRVNDLYHVLFKAIYYDVQFLRLEPKLPNENIISYFKGSPVFRNLIHLELLFHHFHGWDDVVDVLQHCPNLQILSVEKVTQIPNITFRNSWFRTWELTLKINLEKYTNWKCPNYVPKCVSSHLRSCAVTATYHGRRDALLFATYILQNAQLLQAMTIRYAAFSNSIYDWMFFNELNSCPKLSAICAISVEYI